MSIKIEDKLHFTACAIIAMNPSAWLGIWTGMFFPSLLAGFYAAMMAGLAKEFADLTGPDHNWEWRDIAADALGALVGSLAAFTAFID